MAGVESFPTDELEPRLDDLEDLIDAFWLGAVLWRILGREETSKP